MKIEVLFYTQIASIIGFIIALFSLYNLLVRQKDSVIELLKERINLLEKKSPDALIESLHSRVEITKAEIDRLKNDSESHSDEIKKKEKELHDTRGKLDSLMNLLEEHELICPECKSPLLQRHFQTIHGYVGGREVEADIEIVEYECGLVLEDGKTDPISPCQNKTNNR